MDLDGVPRSGLTLKGFATKEVLRITQVEAAGADGAKLPVDVGLETVTPESRSIDIPRIRLPGPLPARLSVSYLVAPGSREGDSHMGFTGRCQGYLGPEFGFVTGRELFLLPEPAEKISGIQVRFAPLPEGWQAIVPWARAGEGYAPGVDGRAAGEHLIAAAIGLGRFRERSFKLGATNFRLFFEASIGAEDEGRTAPRIEAAARYLHDLFRRDLGPEYAAVLLPRAPTGDEIAGEGWATGQGQTFVPLTGNRLQQFAANLLDAYLRYAPYRSEIRSAEEFWLVDGLRNLYAWRTAAAVGLISDEDVIRGMATGYLTSLNVQGIERDLEKLYSATGSQRIPREVLAPMALATLDRDLRETSGGKASLDRVVAATFAGRRAGSFWSEIERQQPGPWQDFRRRYVQGKAALPVERFYDIKATRETPEPAGGPVVRNLTIAFTGKAHGYLENCGCKVNQSGGVARRATVLQAIRKADPNALLLDAGDAFLMPDKQAALDFLSREEQALYLRTMDAMHYQAAAIGTSELAFGPDHFRKEIQGRATPFLSANIREAGRPLAPSSLVLRAGPVRVGVIGIYEPPRGRAANALFEDHTAMLQFDDPVATLKRDLPELRKRSDLVVALGRITPETIRQVVATCPDLDLILSTEYDAAIRLPGTGEVHQEDHGGFIGRTLIAYSNLTNYGFYTLRLGLDRAGRIAKAQFEERWLHDDVKDDPSVRGMLNGFYDQVGRQAAAQESVPPLFASDAERLHGEYVGAARCASCHAEEMAQWKRTKHASAYKTLLDRHRHFQPKCVSCHVVGYGTPRGYRLGMTGESLANVQCEVCHGPGAAHAKAPAAGNIRRAVPAQVCLECHTPDHSDHFVYEERLPKVKHDYYD